MIIIIISNKDIKVNKNRLLTTGRIINNFDNSPSGTCPLFFQRKNPKLIKIYGIVNSQFSATLRRVASLNPRVHGI